jgi:hypothetical protein
LAARSTVVRPPAADGDEPRVAPVHWRDRRSAGTIAGMRKGIAGPVLAVAAFLAFAVSAARAVQEELLDEARKLVLEAKPLVEKANDMDLDMEARKPPRKEAFGKLKHARELYDKYLDANPSMEDKLDKEYVDLVAMLYWIKKDSTLGDLEKEGPPADLPHAPDAAPGSPAAPDKPKPPEWKDKATPGQPDTGGDAKAPAPDLPERAKRQFAAIVDYQKKNPGDLPRLLEFWQKFLADFPDPSLPEYGQAVERIGKINDRMKGVLKEVGKRDPDSIPGAESKDEKAIFGRLSQDFSAKDDDVRRRAAKLMADSRARSATFFLARGLTDKDAEVARICREGLIAIGGTFAGENLVKLYRDAPKERQQLAMDVLKAITLKGAVDAVAESPHIARFALSNDDDVADGAISLLTQMGKAGGPGLVAALDTKIVEKKIKVIGALADVKYYRSATKLAERFLGTSNTDPAPRLRDAAMEALKKMGVYVIPYLIPMLRSGSGQYTAFVITKITGQPFGFNDEKKVRAWWNENKPKDAEEP